MPQTQKVYYFKTLPTIVSNTGVFGTIQTSPNPQLTSQPNAEYRFKAILNDGEFEVNAQTELAKEIQQPRPLPKILDLSLLQTQESINHLSIDFQYGKFKSG